MKKNSWKTLTWVIEFAFLFLALTAPLNPLLRSKEGTFIWCFLMIGLGTIGVVLAAFKAYPPEEISL
jgi:uncharacterized membrane protein